MLIQIAGGTVYDPTTGENGITRDVFVRDERIVIDPGPGARPDRRIDASGALVMAGAIDVHSHIAGGNVNNARLLTPDIQRNLLQREFAAPPRQDSGPRSRPGSLPFASTRWTARGTGYRYAEMGYSTVVEPAMLPLSARATHLELGEIPIIDTASLAVLGNDRYLLELLRREGGGEALRDYVAWTLDTSRALGIKVINAGGGAAFRANTRSLGLDDEVPGYGMTSRAIVQSLQHAVHDLGVPHPLHVHCNNLGQPGNVATAIATIEAAGGLPMHLAHVQFYGYGDEGKRGFSSGAAALAEAVNANPNVTVDIGQVMFGQTVTISTDILRQFSARQHASPRKWMLTEADGGGGGIVPYAYSRKNFVNAMQWAIGLELFLMIDDPARVFFTTDHPNGAPFTLYPRLLRLLMDRDYRGEWFETISPAARKRSVLGELHREYSLYDVATMTRSAPAKLLGLTDRGSLRPGSLADIAVYRREGHWDQTFEHCAYLLKNGRVAVDDGKISSAERGRAQVVQAPFDQNVERRVDRYFKETHGIPAAALKIADGEIRGTRDFDARPCG